MTQLLTKLQNSLQNWPGRKRFGFYSFLPIFFVAGASLEFVMIHWKPNGHNFYNTYKKSIAASIVDRKEYLAAEEAKSKLQQDTP